MKTIAILAFQALFIFGSLSAQNPIVKDADTSQKWVEELGVELDLPIYQKEKIASIVFQQIKLSKKLIKYSPSTHKWVQINNEILKLNEQMTSGMSDDQKTKYSECQHKKHVKNNKK